MPNASGEHGKSRALLWSSAQVAGTPVLDLVRKDELADFKARVEMQVRNANITIIEGINASQYGIGMACGRVVEAMTRDERAALERSAATMRQAVAGLAD
jgi:L-lactate dehydrogenase